MIRVNPRQMKNNKISKPIEPALTHKDSVDPLHKVSPKPSELRPLKTHVDKITLLNPLPKELARSLIGHRITHSI